MTLHNVTSEKSQDDSSADTTRAAIPIDLDVSCNEGACAIDDLASALSRVGPSLVERYPCQDRLEKLLARRVGLAPERVVVTGGGDDGIDRAFRVFVGAPSGRRRTVVSHEPTFSMIATCCWHAGGVLIDERWLDGPFPVEDMERRVDDHTAMVVLVTPNNPTGIVIPPGDIVRLAEKARVVGASVLVDLAYVEFADADPTGRLLTLDNVVIVRTLSKAWGLAGLRVGFLIASAEIATRLRQVGGPFPVSSISILLAERALETGETTMQTNVDRVRTGRIRLARVIEQCGGFAWRGEGNFVLARFPDAASVRDALAQRGVAVRSFSDDPSFADLLRITCPAREERLDRLVGAIQEAAELQPPAPGADR